MIKQRVFLLGILIPIFFTISCRDKSTMPDNKRCTLSEEEQKELNIFIESFGEKQHLEEVSVDYDFSISLPPNYTIRRHDVEDFIVYYIVSADTTTQPDFYGGVYFGNHPNTFKTCEDDVIETRIEEKVFGEKTEWIIKNCDAKYSVQTIIESGNKDCWCVYMHLFGFASSEFGLEKMFEIFRTLSRSEKTKLIDFVD